jgi:EAL domain-containing protein (putative c-di-GMP-specific phosphodiesterase class I)
MHNSNVGPGANPLNRPPPADTVRHLRLERDRHVAFAFAGADLLIEVGAEGTISAASGAAHAVLGVDTRTLVGRPLTDFVTTGDRTFVHRLLRQVCAQFRTDPAVVHLLRSDETPVSILLGGCRLPDHADRVFLSVALPPDALAPIPQPRDEATGLLTADAFQAAAERASGHVTGGPRQLQLVRLDGLAGAARHLSPDRAAMLMEEIGAALRVNSIGGDAAGRLGDEAFGLVTKPDHAANRDAALAADLAVAMRGAGISDGQVASHVARIDIVLGGLNNNDAGRVLKYAMNTFVKSVGDFDIGSLQSGFTAAVNEAASRFAVIRQMLTDERFTIVYQPVVDLTTRKVHHYEALSRFAEGTDTFETVVFSEDVGLIMEFDLIVCRQVIEAIERGGTARVAVNLSGRSVQNAAFRSALTRLIGSLGANRQRLLFELTESAAVVKMAEAEEFLSQLRLMGHAVCLDDFGAGAAAYSYLRRFDVDFVKIDGPFLQAAGQRGRERALIRSICVLSSEIGCSVIGEMIEDEAGAALAASLGIGYGQGWLFGKPVAELPVPPVRSMRRKGSAETWQ